MSRPSTPSKVAASSGSSRSHRDDVLNFLDNLDSFDGPPAGTGGTGSVSRSSVANHTPKTSVGASTGASTTAGVGAGGGVPATSEDPQSVLDFLDEIVTRRGPTATTTTSSSFPKKSKTASSAISGGIISRSGSRGAMRDKASYLSPRDPASFSPSTGSIPVSSVGTSPAALAAEKLESTPALVQDDPATSSAGSGWGWGSVWSQASNIVQQARTVAEEVSSCPIESFQIRE